jgi:hypothetical protein
VIQNVTGIDRYFAAAAHFVCKISKT